MHIDVEKTEKKENDNGLQILSEGAFLFSGIFMRYFLNFNTIHGTYNQFVASEPPKYSCVFLYDFFYFCLCFACLEFIY